MTLGGQSASGPDVSGQTCSPSRCTSYGVAASSGRSRTTTSAEWWPATQKVGVLNPRTSTRHGASVSTQMVAQPWPTKRRRGPSNRRAMAAVCPVYIELTWVARLHPFGRTLRTPTAQLDQQALKWVARDPEEPSVHDK